MRAPYDFIPPIPISPERTDRPDATMSNQMSGFQSEDEEEVSLLAVATTLLRNRWRLLAGMLIGGAIAVYLSWGVPLYAAKASFFPENAAASGSGLASIAGQFGVSIPATGSQSLTPDFYAKLLKTRVLLLPIV